MHGSHNELRLITACPGCARSYTQEDRLVIDRSKRRSVMYLLCASCQRALLVSVVRKEDGVLCTGVFTDCSGEDAKRAFSGDVVSTDDILEAHEALKLDKFLQIR